MGLQLTKMKQQPGSCTPSPSPSPSTTRPSCYTFTSISSLLQICQQWSSGPRLLWTPTGGAPNDAAVSQPPGSDSHRHHNAHAQQCPQAADNTISLFAPPPAVPVVHAETPCFSRTATATLATVNGRVEAFV